MNDAKAQYLSGIGKNGDNLISLLNMSSVNCRHSRKINQGADRIDVRI